MLIIKGKDRYYFASEPTVCYDGNTFEFKCEPDNFFFWKEDSGAIVLWQNSVTLFCDIIRYKNLFDCELSNENLKKSHRKIVECMNQYDLDMLKMRIKRIYVAKDDKMFEIDKHGCVDAIDGDVFYDFDDMTLPGITEGIDKDQDPYERIYNIYNKLRDFYRNLFPVMTLDSREGKYKIIYEDGRVEDYNE